MSPQTPAYLFLLYQHVLVLEKRRVSTQYLKALPSACVSIKHSKNSSQFVLATDIFNVPIFWL